MKTEEILGSELPPGATVWVHVVRDTEGADVRVFASQAAARRTIDSFLAREQQEGREWIYKGDISGCGVAFEWAGEGLQLILAQSLVRR